MPIREYHGKTGTRLIAEEPIEPTEVVTVHTDQMVLRATYQGNKSNGYSALSPAPFSLPVAILQQIEGECNDLLNAIAESEMEYHPMSDSLRTILNEDVAWLQSVVPTLGSIMKGRPLVMVLPRPFWTTRYELGEVRRYEIAT